MVQGLGFGACGVWFRGSGLVFGIRGLPETRKSAE